MKMAGTYQGDWGKNWKSVIQGKVRRGGGVRRRRGKNNNSFRILLSANQPVLSHSVIDGLVYLSQYTCPCVYVTVHIQENAHHQPLVVERLKRRTHERMDLKSIPCVCTTVDLHSQKPCTGMRYGKQDNGCGK